MEPERHVISQEISKLSLKLNEISPSNEILLAMLSIFLTLYTSYSQEIWNFWGVSFGSIFVLWALWSRIQNHQNRNSSETTLKEIIHPNLVTYYGQIVGKNVYSGIQAFGILALISLGVYLALYTGKTLSHELWGIPLVLFLIELAIILPFISEDRICDISSDFLKRIYNVPLKLTVKEATEIAPKLTPDLSTGTAIFAFIMLGVLFFGSIWSVYKFLILILEKTQELPSFLLILALQYLSVWALMATINKNQVHKDIVNATNYLLDLIYTDVPEDILSVAEHIKYTNFRKMTPLKILEFYLYLHHPLYEKMLTQNKRDEINP
jgi:hypothetical protein